LGSGEQVIIEGKFDRNSLEIQYTLQPSLNLILYNNMFNFSIVQPEQGVAIHPNSFSCNPVRNNKRICILPSTLPQDMMVESVQVKLQLFSVITDVNLYVNPQVVLLSPPISYYSAKDIHAAFTTIGETIDIVTLSSTALSVMIGSTTLLKPLQLLSYIEVIIYLNVIFPTCTEDLFSMISSQSKLSYLPNLIFRTELHAKHYELPDLFAKRGHRNVSLLQRQVTFYLIIVLLILIKYFFMWLSHLASKKSVKLSNLLMKFSNNYNFQYFYSYIDAGYFKISMHAVISTVYLKHSELPQISPFLYIFDLAVAIATLTAFLINTAFTFYATNYFAKNRSKSDHQNNTKDANQISTTQRFSRLHKAKYLLLSYYECTVKKVNLEGKLHGKYTTAALQTRSLLCVVIVALIFTQPIAQVATVAIIQLSSVYVYLIRQNFKLKSDWFFGMVIHSAILFACLFTLPLAISFDKLNLKQQYFYVGLPIAILILTTFIANISSMVWALTSSLRRTKENKVSSVDDKNSKPTLFSEMKSKDIKPTNPSKVKLIHRPNHVNSPDADSNSMGDELPHSLKIVKSSMAKYADKVSALSQFTKSRPEGHIKGNDECVTPRIRFKNAKGQEWTGTLHYFSGLAISPFIEKEQNQDQIGRRQGSNFSSLNMMGK